jgi:tetratricopeptide (TPR) repeat protein
MRDTLIRRSCQWLVSLALVASQYATAALADSAADCKSPTDLDKRIVACTAIIAKGDGSAFQRAWFYLKRGAAYHDKQDYDVAIKDYEAALGIIPAMPEALYERGMSRAAKGNFTAALEDYDQAIAKIGTQKPYHFYRQPGWGSR